MHNRLKGAMTMKKAGLFICALALSATAAHAANGDIIGKIYSTDILAEINGKPVPSYNIGGKTAIVLEDLAEQSYAHVDSYDDSRRTLTVTMGSPEGLGTLDVTRGEVGKIVGDIYESDIKVIINGSEIRGMNIGGKTAVAIEDLGALDGTSENEKFGFSKYLCNYTYNNDKRLISLDFVSSKLSIYTVNETYIKYSLNDNIMTAEFDRMEYYPGNSFNLSDDFKKETNILKPLYYDDGKEKTEIGCMYVSADYDSGEAYGNYYITKPEVVKEKNAALVTTPPSYDETLKLFDDGDSYETTDRLELEDYTILTVKCLKIPEEDNNLKVAYIAVKKSGGYGCVYGGSTAYTESSVEKTGKNRAVIKMAPFGGIPHGGPGTLNVDIPRDEYYSIR